MIFNHRTRIVYLKLKNMKSMYRTVWLFLCAIVTLSSCVKHGDIFQPKEPERTADLVVPEGFDWSSTRVVELPINSPVSTVASFFLDEACSAEKQIAALMVPEGETTFKFDIPNINKTIYVQYPLETGEIRTLKREIKEKIKSKAISGGADVMFFDQPQLSSSGYTQFINIPNGNKYGTLMFEDTWPETGDYDFNDVVVNYRIVPTYDMSGVDPEASGNTPAKDIVINVSLKICALGGNLPYDFAIQIGQTESHEGSSFNASHLGDITDIESGNKDITVEKLEGTNFPAVIVKGLNSLRGSGYYNTVIKKDNGVNVSFKIRIKGTLEEQQRRMQYGGFTDPKAFDYFLINLNNHREIHLIGFAPTALYTGYDADNIAGGTYYYENDKGLVWGLKAPGTLGWAAERHDIMTVYTEFKRWVTDGGYTIGPNGADPLQWYKYHTTDNFIKP